MNEQPDHEALRSYEHGPPGDTERPAQTWCPGCGQTIIDPIMERICLDCEAEMGSLITTKDLQSEDK